MMVGKIEPGFLPEVPSEELARGRAADAIFSSLCAAIAEGRLLSGMFIHEGSIADSLGVSRTPVREAVQRLRSLGLIDALPGFHTRVAFVSPERTAQALLVFVALFRLVCLEVAPRADASVVAAMRGALDAFTAARGASDDEGMATANFAFYHAATRASENAVLQQSIAHVVYIVRLGGLQLPARIDVDAVHETLRRLLAAFESRDASSAVAAVERLAVLEVPGGR